MDLILIEIIGWLGTVIVVIGQLNLMMKDANKPKRRLHGFTFYLISNIVIGIYSILINSLPSLFTQLFFFIINIVAIRNNLKEMKKGDSN